MNSVANRRKDLQNVLGKAKELGNLDSLKEVGLKALAEPFNKFLGKLHKLFTVGKIVDKVMATKEKVTICERIPLNASSLSVQKDGINAEYWHSRSA